VYKESLPRLGSNASDKKEAYIGIEQQPE
jgi:hypothetical protein